MMNSSSSSYEEALKRRWEDHHHRRTQQHQQINIMQQQGSAPNNSNTINHNNNNNNIAYYYGGNNNNKRLLYQGWFTNSDNNVLEEKEEDVVLSRVVPAVTVVLEGRSICQRISLQQHGSYQSLAKALRHMFVEEDTTTDHHHQQLDLSNAIPGHLIAYEDIDNDLLLAGDLSWKDFVRVAKRIRILPAKGNSSSSSRKGTSTRSGE